MYLTNFWCGFCVKKPMRALKTILFSLLFLFMGVYSWAQGSEEVALHSERTSLSKSISVYPNPAVDYVEVNLDQLNANKVKLTLYNIIGNRIQVDTEVIDEHKIRVRVKDFSAGFYLIALRDEETNFKGTYKFLKR